MKRLLVPLLLGFLGLAVGIGAGVALRPEASQAGSQQAASPCGEADRAAATALGTRDPDTPDAAVDDAEYVKLNNQFVVPVVRAEQVEALVVMSLSVEIGQGQRETVYAREPKLRDALLQVLFDHANMGGFQGAFTDGSNLDTLRAALSETARGVLGGAVRSVLIVDIARQDL